MSDIGTIIDLYPKTENILKEVLEGLNREQKTIGSKFFYDKKGSEIFEEICELPEYYVTRSEDAILREFSSEMTSLIGTDTLIIEPGSGSCQKVQYLLRILERPYAYSPVEISKEILAKTAKDLSEKFPKLKIVPICADFLQSFSLPDCLKNKVKKTVTFFPGSTIGNLEPDDAIIFLKKYTSLVQGRSSILIGVDLKKEAHFFLKAYDDSRGVTADFNLNLLTRLNNELQADFDIKKFKHKVTYNDNLGRVEMHLVSLFDQVVNVKDSTFKFKKDETIHTESSYKYSIEEFTEIGKRASLILKKFWTDPNKLFCIYYFEKMRFAKDGQ